MDLTVRNKKGFTLFEILITILILITLFLIVLWALDPAKQLSKTRNAQRMTDVDTILKAVYQYSIDHDGVFPTSITEEEREICQIDAFCDEGIDLSELTNGKIYLPKIPVDPRVVTLDKTGYTIRREYDRIIIRAIYAEGGEIIEVIK